MDYLIRKMFGWYKALDYEEKDELILQIISTVCLLMYSDEKVRIARRKYLDFLIRTEDQTPNTFIYQSYITWIRI